MRKIRSRVEVALSKRDINFLNILDQPYAEGATMRLDQRDRLRMILGFFETVYFLINALYKYIKKKKTDVGDRTLDNLAQALTGDFPDMKIDYSRICMLSGKLASPCGSMYASPGSNQISFSWATCTQSNSHGTDELMAMMFCPASRKFWCEPNLGITRSDGFCTIEVPEQLRESDVHVWLAYRSADQKDQSDSSYMGVRAGQRTGGGTSNAEL